MRHNPLTTIAGLFLFGCLAIVLFSAATAANAAVTKHYAAQTAVLPAYRIILQSRATAPAASGSSFALGLGLAAAVVVIAGATILAMNGGSRLMKELRLSRRRGRRTAAARPPAADTLPALQPLPRLSSHEPGS